MSMLIFIPRPMESESPISVIYRCAHASGFRSLKDFSWACGGLHYSSLSFAIQYGSRTHQLLRNDPLVGNDHRKALDDIFIKGKIIILNPAEENTRINLQKPFIRTELALCPDCIRDGKLNIMHTFAFSEVCPKHSQRYITECPKCYKPFNWITLKNFQCDCTFDLRDSPMSYADNHWSNMAYEAYLRRDQEFYDRLQLIMGSNHILCSSDSRIEALNGCIRIATGDKSAFFHEMHCMQSKYPSLHKRAILAPFMLMKDDTIKNHALEYYCNTLQSRPLSHDPNCECSQLPLTRKELALIWDSKEEASKIIEDTDCTPVKKTMSLNKSQRLYRVKNLCLKLAAQDMDWDSTDIFANPSEHFTLLTAEQTAPLLNASYGATHLLMKANILHSVKLPNQRLTTAAWVDDFKKVYVLESQISALPGVNGETVRAILESVPSATDYNGIGVRFKKHFPQYIRELLDRPKPSETYTSDATTAVDLNSAAILLRLKRADITELIKRNLLTPTPRDRDSNRNTKFITKTSLAKAIEWRQQYVTTSEIARLCQLTHRVFLNRFIFTGYIPILKLDQTLILKEHAEKCVEHHSFYTIAVKSGYDKGNPYARQYRAGIIHPLPSDHPDALRGHLVFRRQDLKSGL